MGIQGNYAESLKEDDCSQGSSLFRTRNHLFRLNVEVVKNIRLKGHADDVIHKASHFVANPVPIILDIKFRLYR